MAFWQYFIAHSTADAIGILVSGTLAGAAYIVFHGARHLLFKRFVYRPHL